jgi:hypothetical protein
MPVFLIYSFYYPAGKIAILVGGKSQMFLAVYRRIHKSGLLGLESRL